MFHVQIQTTKSCTLTIIMTHHTYNILMQLLQSHSQTLFQAFQRRDWGERCTQQQLHKQLQLIYVHPTSLAARITLFFM